MKPCKYSQNLANIYLDLGEGRSKIVLISVSKTMQNLTYINYPTLTSQDDSDVSSTTLDLQDQGSESLLIFFQKCNRDSQLDPNESSEKDLSTPSNAHSKQISFIHIDLENERNQFVLVSGGGNPISGQLSVDVDATYSFQITPKFQSKHCNSSDHAYVNMNPEEDSSSVTLTPHGKHAQHSD